MWSKGDGVSLPEPEAELWTSGQVHTPQGRGSGERVGDPGGGRGNLFIINNLFPDTYLIIALGVRSRCLKRIDGSLFSFKRKFIFCNPPDLSLRFRGSPERTHPSSSGAWRSPRIVAPFGSLGLNLDQERPQVPEEPRIFKAKDGAKGFLGRQSGLSGESTRGR